MIPLDRGYSLDEGKLHTRHPSHPTYSPRRFRTVEAVISVAGPDPDVCEDCYPQEKPKHVSRVSRPRVRKAGGGSEEPLPGTSNGTGPSTRQQRPAWVRPSSPEATSEDGGATDTLQPVPADGDAGQSDRAGPHHPAEEGRED